MRQTLQNVGHQALALVASNTGQPLLWGAVQYPSLPLGAKALLWALATDPGHHDAVATQPLCAWEACGTLGTGFESQPRVTEL